jgi:predicted nucleic acid-binding protein
VKGVLVDTSVWRKYFAGIASARPLGALLEEDGGVLVHPFVVGELVLGGLSAREEALLARLPAARVAAHEDVLAFVRARRLTRRGIGWVDVHLLASALVAECPLWTLDAELAQAADDVAVGYRPA